MIFEICSEELGFLSLVPYWLFAALLLVIYMLALAWGYIYYRFQLSMRRHYLKYRISRKSMRRSSSRENVLQKSDRSMYYQIESSM
jgi:hypothetical protein